MSKQDRRMVETEIIQSNYQILLVGLEENKKIRSETRATRKGVQTGVSRTGKGPTRDVPTGAGPNLGVNPNLVGSMCRIGGMRTEQHKTADGCLNRNRHAELDVCGSGSLFRSTQFEFQLASATHIADPPSQAQSPGLISTTPLFRSTAVLTQFEFRLASADPVPIARCLISTTVNPQVQNGSFGSMAFARRHQCAKWRFRRTAQTVACANGQGASLRRCPERRPA